MRRKVGDLQSEIEVLQARYDELVGQIQELDAQLIQLRAEEALKQEELQERLQSLCYLYSLYLVLQTCFPQ